MHNSDLSRQRDGDFSYNEITRRQVSHAKNHAKGFCQYGAGSQGSDIAGPLFSD
jgi:hypothetical protein